MYSITTTRAMRSVISHYRTRNISRISTAHAFNSSNSSNINFSRVMSSSSSSSSTDTSDSGPCEKEAADADVEWSVMRFAVRFRELTAENRELRRQVHTLQRQVQHLMMRMTMANTESGGMMAGEEKMEALGDVKDHEYSTTTTTTTTGGGGGGHVAAETSSSTTPQSPQSRSDNGPTVVTTTTAAGMMATSHRPPAILDHVVLCMRWSFMELERRVLQSLFPDSDRRKEMVGHSDSDHLLLQQIVFGVVSVGEWSEEERQRWGSFWDRQPASVSPRLFSQVVQHMRGTRHTELPQSTAIIARLNQHAAGTGHALSANSADTLWDRLVAAVDDANRRNIDCTDSSMAAVCSAITAEDMEVLVRLIYRQEDDYMECARGMVAMMKEYGLLRQ